MGCGGRQRFRGHGAVSARNARDGGTDEFDEITRREPDFETSPSCAHVDAIELERALVDRGRKPAALAQPDFRNSWLKRV